MMITCDNLSEITFENENARLLVLDVVGNKDIKIHVCRDTEISVVMALDIWYQVYDERKRLKIRRTLPRPLQRYNLSFHGKHVIEK